MLQKFKELYTKDVIPYLKDTFEYQNIHQIPKIEKIQINRGLGVSAQNTKILKKSVDEFRSITGQQPVITKAKKSIAGFKLREEMELGERWTNANYAPWNKIGFHFFASKIIFNW